MHERNMLWKAHDFLAYARQSLNTQTRIRHRDAETGPGPLAEILHEYSLGGKEV